MKSLDLLLVVLCVQNCFGRNSLKFDHGIPPAGIPRTTAKQPDWSSITQKVDHFNPIDPRTWEMRYMNNSQFFRNGGPMFIFIGGEWAISSDYLTTGQMFDMAEDHNGYMFYTEHRYYGRSYPTENFTVENLQYLSADQALEDLAFFIEHKKQTILGLGNSKVVVVGGSYPGALAAWARIKYPHLIDAALASSAPLKAVADFYEYFQFVGDNLQLASEHCVNTIGEAISAIQEHLNTEDGIKYVSEMINICDKIETSEPEISYFLYTLSMIFGSIVQYAKIGQLTKICDNLLSSSGDPLEKLSAFLGNYYGSYCINGYKFFVSLYNRTNLTLTVNRQWMYQTCTQFGFFQTSDSYNRPFGKSFGLDLYLNMCRDLFGFEQIVLNTGVERTNLVYGSSKPEMTKVVFVYGTGDPWHALGPSEDIGPEAPVIVVNGTSHCADLSSLGKYDIPEMREAKMKVQELITEWIK